MPRGARDAGAPGRVAPAEAVERLEPLDVRPAGEVRQVAG